MPFPENSTVVVAHGAWADGSSWKEVILLVNKQGLQLVAAPLPLTSLSENIVALNRTIARTNGPVIVAGHAYAGAVIAAANDERVKALVYVAALAPEEGETVAQVFYRDEAHPQAPKLAPDKDGVEIKTVLVSDRGRRPYDQSQNAAFHGKSNAGSYSYICRRPYTFAHRAGKGPAGHHCRCA
jgi:hypothetical protein